MMDFFFGMFMCILAVGLAMSMSGPSEKSVQSAAEKLAQIIMKLDEHNRELEQQLDALRVEVGLLKEDLNVDRPAH